MEFSMDKKPPSQFEICLEQSQLKKEMVIYSVRFFLFLSVYIYLNIEVAKYSAANISVALLCFVFMMLTVTLAIHLIFEKQLIDYLQKQHDLSVISRSAVYYTLSMCRQHAALDSYRKAVEKTRELTFGEYLMMKRWTEDYCKMSLQMISMADVSVAESTKSGCLNVGHDESFKIPTPVAIYSMDCSTNNTELIPGYIVL